MTHLNDRQLRILRVLGAADRPLYAFLVEERAGTRTNHRGGSYVPTGTANTLRALARRGLVTHGGTYGCFVQALWRITDDGRDVLQKVGGWDE